MTLQEAKSAIIENRKRAPYLSNWLHTKSNGRYVVSMHVIIEATMEPSVVYYKKFADPAETWCRPAAEFFDGRFEPIASEAAVVEAYEAGLRAGGPHGTQG